MGPGRITAARQRYYTSGGRLPARKKEPAKHRKGPGKSRPAGDKV